MIDHDHDDSQNDVDDNDDDVQEVTQNPQNVPNQDMNVDEGLPKGYFNVEAILRHKHDQ